LSKKLSLSLCLSLSIHPLCLSCYRVNNPKQPIYIIMNKLIIIAAFLILTYVKAQDGDMNMDNNTMMGDGMHMGGDDHNGTDHNDMSMTMGDGTMNMGDDHNDMDNNHTMGDDTGMMDVVYCAKDCSSSPDDPCGDGKAQTSSCITTTVGDDGRSMVGCTLATCKAACAGKDMDTSTNGSGLYCFSSVGMGMYPQEDIAKISAVSRGCQGAHQMSSMFMVGETMTTCETAYKKEGVTFTGIAEPNMGDGHNDMDHDHTMAKKDPTSSSTTPPSVSLVIIIMTMTTTLFAMTSLSWN